MSNALNSDVEAIRLAKTGLGQRGSEADFLDNALLFVKGWKEELVLQLLQGAPSCVRLRCQHGKNLPPETTYSLNGFHGRGPKVSLSECWC